MANAFPSVKKHVLDQVVDRVATGLSATLLKQRHCNALLVLESPERDLEGHTQLACYSTGV
eukprot:16014648-Heterocapsa_arctica.AAC.1